MRRGGDVTADLHHVVAVDPPAHAIKSIAKIVVPKGVRS
jgi:hypothetical protein